MPRSVSGLLRFWLLVTLCVPLQVAADPGAAHKGLAHDATPLQGVRPFPDADLGSVPPTGDQESAESEDRWTRMVDKGASVTTFGTIGQYVGGNIPGKPRRYLLNTGGRPKLFEVIAATKADDYRAFEMRPSPARADLT